MPITTASTLISSLLTLSIRRLMCSGGSLIYHYCAPCWKLFSIVNQIFYTCIDLGHGDGNDASGSLEVVVRGATLLGATSWFLDPWIPVVEEIAPILVIDLEDIPHPGRYYSRLRRCFLYLSKVYSTKLSGCMLQGKKEHGKTSEFYEHGPIAVLHLL